MTEDTDTMCIVDDAKLRDALSVLRDIAAEPDQRIDEDVVISEIKEAVANYVLRGRDDEREIIGAPRRDLLIGLSNNVEKLTAVYKLVLSEPSFINPFILALESDPDFQDSFEATSYISEMISQLTLHSRWLERVIEVATNAVGSKGRPRGSLEQELIYALADIYEDHTQQRAAHSSKSDPETNAQRIYGPFVRFVEIVVTSNKMLLSVEKYWGGLIHQALPARKTITDADLRKELRDYRRSSLMDHFGDQVYKTSAFSGDGFTNHGTTSDQLTKPHRRPR